MQNDKIETKANDQIVTTKKYLLPGKSMKPYIMDIFNKEGMLASYGIDNIGPDYIEKIYFDTVDRFFFGKGLLITLTKSKVSKVNKIEVRYEGEDKRVPFVSDMPKSLTLEINKKDFFSAHFDFIIDSLLAIMPAGLGVNIPNYVNSIIPVFVVVKKATRYRVINNNGLKVVFSFEDTEFLNNANRNKHKHFQLEIKLENREKHELFEKFIKRLILQVPTIIPMKHSDILNGLDYTSMTDEKKPSAKSGEKTPTKK